VIVLCGLMFESGLDWSVQLWEVKLFACGMGSQYLGCLAVTPKRAHGLVAGTLGGNWDAILD
jgi:hypothetical protein